MRDFTQFGGSHGCVDEIAQNRLSVWDAAILDAAADAGCELLLSDDLQHGFRWRGTTAVNPFLNPRPPLPRNLLDSQ